MPISYSAEARPAAAVIAELYRQSPLIRPVDDVDRIERMYRGSNLVLTAWNDATLVGILRGWTDGAFDGYVCDLAIRPQYQKLGIGRELLQRAVGMCPQVQFVLRASRIAVDYYRHIGWKPVENGWFWPRES